MVTRVIRGVEADGSLGFARCALSLSGLCTKLVVPIKTCGPSVALHIRSCSVYIDWVALT